MGDDLRGKGTGHFFFPALFFSPYFFKNPSLFPLCCCQSVENFISTFFNIEQSSLSHYQELCHSTLKNVE